MAEPGSIDLNSLARQSREKAILQAEENRKDALNAAAKARERALQNAADARAEAVKQAQAKLELPQRRLTEARDRVESRLRKHELREARRTQEQLQKKAEDDRLKAVKQAEEMYKRQVAEAAETCRHIIRQAYEAEKKMKREVEQAIKTRKEADRKRVEDEHKAGQRAKQETVQTKIPDQKAAISETPEKLKPAVKPDTNEFSKISLELSKVSEPGQAKNRTGMIKLSIAPQDAGFDHMLDFENSLRKIPDIRIVMVGGTSREGAQIIVSSEKSVALSDILRQLPMVENITDRPADILVKLKQVVTNESNA